MRPIDHAEAHERLADLALEPASMARLDTAPEHADLRDHLASCASCRADLASWRATLVALDEAVGSTVGRPGRLRDLVSEAPVEPPASLRAAVARIPGPGAVPLRDPTIPTAVSGAPRLARIGWRRALASVAVLIVLVSGGTILRDQATTNDSTRATAQALEQVAGVLDRVLLEPGHREVALADASGAARGTLAWSTHDLVVMTTALAPGAPGTVYRCWVERAGVRTPVGQMWFAGSLASWTGSLDDWATISLAGGGRFGVSLEPSAGGIDGTPVLVARLPTDGSPVASPAAARPT